MKDSPIILLDEALSSLDAENAVAIQKGIEEMIKGKTVFLVSHTLSYIQNSDQILVLSDGILQGCGKHEELLQTVPLYQTMWEKRNPLKTGSWHNERQEQTSCVRGGPSGNHERLKALGNLK